MIKSNQIDVLCMVCKIDEKNRPNFLDETKKFVKLFGRSAISSMMIMFLEQKGNQMADVKLRGEIENSQGYQYLMEEKKNHKTFMGEKDAVKSIPFCRWNNLAYDLETISIQRNSLQAAINCVETPFTLAQIDNAIQLIRNELEMHNIRPVILTKLFKLSLVLVLFYIILFTFSCLLPFWQLF